MFYSWSLCVGVSVRNSREGEEMQTSRVLFSHDARGESALKPAAFSKKQVLVFLTAAPSAGITAANSRGRFGHRFTLHEATCAQTAATDHRSPLLWTHWTDYAITPPYVYHVHPSLCTTPGQRGKYVGDKKWLHEIHAGQFKCDKTVRLKQGVQSGGGWATRGTEKSKKARNGRRVLRIRAEHFMRKSLIKTSFLAVCSALSDNLVIFTDDELNFRQWS